MIKLLSVNIEGKRHLEKITKLIEKINPDIICFQEIFEEDVSIFSKLISGNNLFSPMIYKAVVDNLKTDYRLFGVAIISKFKFEDTHQDYYFRNKNELRFHRPGIYTDLAMVLLSADFLIDSKQYKISTTHFCVSRNGEADDFQRENIKGLMNSLNKNEEFVLCGDLNAPRGKEIFSIINSKYKDNIDKKYNTSIDKDLHKSGDLQLMVDCLFSTQEYNISNMYFETGVSDHYAIVADIEKII